MAGSINEDEVSYRIQQYILSRPKPAKKKAQRAIKPKKNSTAPMGSAPTLEEFIQMLAA